MKNLKYFLKEINIINQRIKDREEYEETFNLFDLMCKRNDERYLHSRFLSILFDPAGSHKMKDSFVRIFVDKILVEKLDLRFEYNLSSLEVYPNENTLREHKRIDILLIDRQKKSAVIIENKIGAPDSNHEEEGQIERYYRIITQKEGIPEDSISVLYLSIDRDAPSDESVSTSGLFPKLRGKVKSIHYGVEILDWLRNCVRECYDKPVLRESIMQYIRLVEDMTNNNTSEEDIKSLMQLVGKNDDNLMSAKRLIDNSKHLHWWAIFEFWKLLSVKFVALGFKIRQRIENRIIDDFVHGSAASRNKADFKLKLTTPDDINFTINASHNNCICVGVTDNDVNSGLEAKAEAFFKANKEVLDLESCENRPFYKFYKYIYFANSKRLCLGAFGEELTFSLVSEKCREEIVNIVIMQTQELLKHYKESLK